MKEVQLIFALAGALVLSSFSIYNTQTLDSKSHAIEIKQDGWGPYKRTSCFRYLEYQIKKDDYAGKWFIRFKNNYNKSISMSIEVTGNTGDKTDSGRFTVKSGDTRSQYYFVDGNASRIDFTINKVKFGDTSWGGPYADCDY